MSYEAKEGENGAWIVVNTDTGETRETHEPPDAEEKAKRQAKLLEHVAADPAWEAEAPPKK